MVQQETYEIEKQGNVVIFHSPVFLSKEMVDNFLVEVDEIIQQMPVACEEGAPNEPIRRCAIVMDFSKLSVSSMETDQMAEFVSLMAHHRFRSLVSIPPGGSVFGESQVVALLNKSLPMFGKKNIHVFIEKDMNAAMEKIKDFPCFIE